MCSPCSTPTRKRTVPISPRVVAVWSSTAVSFRAALFRPVTQALKSACPPQGAAGVRQPLVAPDLTGADPGQIMGEITNVSQLYVNQITEMTEELRHLQETTRALNTVSDVLLDSYRAITENSENITRSSNGYVELMQDLNRNISGLNTIYEIQLKSVSSQLDAIDRVNRGIKDISDMYTRSSQTSAKYCEETEKMARYMKQLNSVYEKMITAMTINMQNPMMGGSMAGTNPFNESMDRQ